jgi:hypothetical protein
MIFEGGAASVAELDKIAGLVVFEICDRDLLQCPESLCRDTNSLPKLRDYRCGFETIGVARIAPRVRIRIDGCQKPLDNISPRATSGFRLATLTHTGLAGQPRTQ